MSNLQDQFDKREPAGFDSEALWSRIERPKKKRRPGWLLFFGLFALTAATASWWVMQPVGTGSQPQEKASLSRQKNLEKDIAERSMSTETQKLEKGKQSSKLQKEESSANPDLAFPTRKAETNDRSSADLSTSSGHPSHSVSPYLITHFEKNTSSSEIPSEDAPQKHHSTASLQETYTRTAGISKLSNHTYFVKDHKKNIPLPTGFDKVEQSLGRKKNLNNNRIEISIGSGSHSHLFEGDNCDLRKEEKGQLDLSLGLSYRKYLSKDLFMFSSLRFAIHNSRIRYSTTSIERIIEDMDELTLIETTTDYWLYNQYRRIEFTVGAGKSWSLGHYDLTLSAGLGATSWLKIDADYFDSGEELRPSAMASDRSPAFFGLFQASMSRELFPGLDIGLYLSGQTPLDLSVDGEDCEHRMFPFGGGIMVGKRF
jgi:hypothetical protein